MGVKFNLDDALVFYGSYHNNKINQLIHVIFVPCIVWSLMVLLDYMDFTSELKIHPLQLVGIKQLYFPLSYIGDNFLLSPSLLVAIILTYYYLSLTYFPALSYSLLVLWPILFSANNFYLHTPNAWQYALALHIFSWYMQIHPGHMIFEGRRPAIADDTIGGLLAAPLFTWFEVLFFFGWNTQLKDSIQVKIDRRIAEWKAKELSVQKKKIIKIQFNM